MMRWHCKGDTTFLEAFRQTGRILNISATPGHKHSPSMLLNYVTTPHVVIWTAILASTYVDHNTVLL
jgi:predicted acylesterase/phospholipase RssA